MLGALLYLRITSFANWLRQRGRRLRQPKYLLGAIVGIAYFYFFFFRGFEPPRPTVPGEPVLLPTDWLPLASAVGALALLLFFACLWIVPTARAALGFSEAEIAFLFPAPVTRRSLVHFRLLSAQLRGLLGATIMMLFSQRWTFLGGNALTHALGWWIVFSSLNLHLAGARFTLTRLSDAGLGLWRRRLLVLAALAALLALAFHRAPPLTPVAAPGPLDFGPVTAWIIQFAHTAPLSWALYPFTLIVAPFLAPDIPAFLVALAPAVGVIALHYLWVVRTALDFEDASVDQAQQRSARVAAWRAGGPRPNASPATARAAPFALAPTGWPELAFLWKNLLSTWPYFTWRVFLGTAAVLFVAFAWLHRQPFAPEVLPGIGGFMMAFLAYALIVGPQFARQDIRSDLSHADILKTYPLPGWRLVLGQLLTPLFILTGFLWLALLVIALSLGPASADTPWLTPAVRTAGLLGLATLLPLLAALQLLVPNAAALVFPGWFHATRARGGGPEIIGQRMIFFFAQLLAMLVALAPAVLLGAATLLVQVLLGPVVAVMLASSAMLVVLAAEVAAGIWFLGRRFEQLDLSAELRA